MAVASIESGSELAQQIQSAIQPKLIENGWMTDETDQTLSEYVTMMIVNGKDQQSVQAELGNDLLGVGEEDQAVQEFVQWLFDQVRALASPQQQNGGDAQPSEDQPQPISTVQDAAMEDTPAADAPYVNNFPYSRGRNRFGYRARSVPRLSDFDHLDVHGSLQQQTCSGKKAHAQWPVDDFTMNQQLTEHTYSPTGPRSMRNGQGPQRGRGGRMLGQMNRQMDRSTELPDNLRRIKGAAGGSGRINAHSGRDAPRGPRGNTNGLQRMMNGGRGGNSSMNVNAMMNGMGGANQQQQMQFMQMMEMQANLMQQMIQANGGQMPNLNGGHNNGRGGRGRGRGGHRGDRQQESRLKAVDGKLPDGALPAGPGGASGGDGMEVDGEGGDKFSTPCRFDLACTNAACPFAHHGPATPGAGTIDTSITCSYGVACTNNKCVGKHPSPAQKTAHLKQTVDCKFYPNCTNPRCPFNHPSDMPPCRNGADCTQPGCKFGHSKIMCRYNPCLNPACTFKHADGQKRGKFEDKVWTSETGDGGKAERFADFSNNEGQGEELILPGRSENQENGTSNEQDQSSAMETQVVTDVVT